MDNDIRKNQEEEVLSFDDLKKGTNNQYHPPACASLELELRDAKEDLVYYPELTLNPKPNQIDLLIVSRSGKARSTSGLAAIFKKYNIVEYKSPNQTMDIAIYNRTVAYAHLLAARYGGKLRPVRDVTLTFIRKGKPVVLMRELEASGFMISKHEKGIYHVTKENGIDIQIVVTKELGEAYHWVTMLTDEVEYEDMERILKDIEGLTDVRDLLNAEAVIDLVIKLNQDKDWVRRIRGMGALRDLFKDEFDEKDREIEKKTEENKELSEQLQTQSEKLQTQSEQLQTQNEQMKLQSRQLKLEQEKNTRLQQEVDELKHQLRELAGKIAML